MTAPKRRWFSFSLRTMFVAVTVAACLLYLLTGSPAYVVIPLILLFSAIYPTALLVGVFYGRSGVRAFCVGAVIPAAGFFSGTMSEYTSQMVRAHGMLGSTPSLRGLFEGTGPMFRTWFAISLGVSVLGGLVTWILVSLSSNAEPPATHI